MGYFDFAKHVKKWYEIYKKITSGLARRWTNGLEKIEKLQQGITNNFHDKMSVAVWWDT